MIKLVCRHCGGRLSIPDAKVILDGTAAQLVQTMICDECGTRYDMGDELFLAMNLDVTQRVAKNTTVITTMDGEPEDFSLPDSVQLQENVDTFDGLVLGSFQVLQSLATEETHPNRVQAGSIPAKTNT